MAHPVGYNGQNSWWTDDKVALLKKLKLDDHLSFTQIAHEMGISRNKVCGKLHRLGLTSPAPFMRDRVEKPPRKRKPRITIFQANGSSSHRRIILRAESKDAIKLRCAGIEPRNLGLLDLQRNDCRYPYGDGPFTFCGHAQLDGSPYCAAHARLTTPVTCLDRSAAQLVAA